MAEYIEREALMSYPIRANKCDKEHANEDFILGVESVLEYTENLPAADVAPVVHAAWVADSYGFRQCSVCGWEWDESEYYLSLYCPDCGALMDSE